MASTLVGDVSGVENSVSPTVRLRLTSLKLHKLGESDITARHATHTEFSTWAQSIVPIEAEEGIDLETWTVEERRDFINWCLERNFITAENGRLIPLVCPLPPLCLLPMVCQMKATKRWISGVASRRRVRRTILRKRYHRRRLHRRDHHGILL